MGTTLAICNQKGGVGKTTTAINLAATLAQARRRVLLVDLDPQGNATTGCGLNKKTLEHSTTDVLLGDANIAQARVPAAHGGFDVLGADPELTVAEVRIMNLEGREGLLRAALRSVDYDYILIDCPPALNILTVNALVAADKVLVPTQCEYYALEGLDSLLSTIDRITASANRNLSIAGILRTMTDMRNNLCREVSDTLCGHFGERMYRTCIPRNVTLAEAPSHGMPAITYDPSSTGAASYVALAGELMRREEEAS